MSRQHRLRLWTVPARLRLADGPVLAQLVVRAAGRTFESARYVVACDMITVPEAARRIGRNPETVRRWIRAGRLRSQRIGTQHLVDEDELRLVAADETPLELPQAWRERDDGSPLPDWERIVRDARERH
jgi:excisionase family DNA binding protein